MLMCTISLTSSCIKACGTGGKATYTDFPLAYGEGNAKDGWEADGVHLNLEGYSCVAERIAPLVKTLVAEGEDSTE